jgi:hypothetical protein
MIFNIRSASSMLLEVIIYTVTCSGTEFIGSSLKLQLITTTYNSSKSVTA